MTLNPVTDAFTDELRQRLPEAAFRPPGPHYLEEPRGLFVGTPGLVLAPDSAAEVATILGAANAARIAVIPYGGGTGLVGGQLLPDGPAPIILSLERMTEIRAVHSAENVIVAEAGAVLHDVQLAAEAADRLFPLWLASEGSCRIGGNLATNAGGINVIRYGTARDLCLGLEVVLPTGEIWHGLKRLRKDNTGYDLKNLMIGSEGTLGVITAASLRLFPRPAEQGAALMVVPNPASALDLLALTSARVGEGLSAFEMIDGTGLHFLAETMPQIRQPFPEPPKWLVLVELGLSVGQDPAEILTETFADAAGRGLVLDGLIAQSKTQRQEFWNLRESIPAANKRIGSISSQDISLPLSAIPDFIDIATGALTAIGEVRINCFGHLGDGNLHFNIFPAKGRSKADYPDAPAKSRRIINDLVSEFDGSFSAEHGVGRAKVEDLERYADPVKLAAMRAIKSALDPNGIMNPGAVLRA
ncbi:MAG: FAD-binding oxidoreductase [Paracoccaceae bacterium]